MRNSAGMMLLINLLVWSSLLLQQLLDPSSTTAFATLNVEDRGCIPLTNGMVLSGYPFWRQLTEDEENKS